MALPIDPTNLPAVAQKVIGGKAPPQMRLVAARGVLPGAKPDVIVTVMVALLSDAEPDIVTAARKSLTELPRPVLEGAISTSLQKAVVSSLGEIYAHDVEVVDRLMKMPSMDGEIASGIAARATEAIGELLATNEEFLLINPVVIEALYMNRNVRMSTADRLLEFAVRNDVQLGIPQYKEVADAIRGELADRGGLAGVDDKVIEQANALGQQLQEVVEKDQAIRRDNDGEEEVAEEMLPLTALIAKMTITQKIRRAMLGTSAERMLLVREKNRLVATAAATSPMLKEKDAEQIAASRNVIDDVLRCIAQNREFVRSYSIKMALVNNPRTPFTFSSRLVPHLRDNDVRNLAKSKGIPQNVRTAARQQMDRKKKR